LRAKLLCPSPGIMVFLKVGDDAEHTWQRNRRLRDAMLNLENEAMFTIII